MASGVVPVFAENLKNYLATNRAEYQEEQARKQEEQKILEAIPEAATEKKSKGGKRKLTLEILRGFLKKNGQKTSGSKKDLMERVKKLKTVAPAVVPEWK